MIDADYGTSNRAEEPTVQISVDTKTDSLDAVLATLGAAYGVSLAKAARAGAAPRSAARASGSKRAVREATSPEASKVRTWAKANKIRVSSHGRLPAQLIARYEAAH